MPTRNVVLSEEQEKHLRDLVDQGRYQNVSEVIRTGVRPVLSHEAEERARIEGLRAAVAHGEADVARGEVVDFEPALLDRIEDEIVYRVEAERLLVIRILHDRQLIARNVDPAADATT